MRRLNKEQYAASRSHGGVHLVIAGAGTGKTSTLIEKVCSVMRYGNIPSEKILVLTFSRKAAGELKERIASLRLNVPEISTFHAYSLGLLRRFSGEFMNEYGFKAFPKVIDDEGKDEIIGGLIKERRREFLGLPDAAVRRFMERGRWSDGDLEKLEACGLSDALKRVRGDYAENKRLRGVIDFDDIIFFCGDLLKRRGDILEEVRDGLDYILVDEYQDTSDADFEMLRLLSRDGEKNLFVVGDDWQAIYGFRNARVEYILGMKKYFPHLAVHKLTINYRSRSEIVSLSNNFIKGNKNRTKKKLVSTKGRGGTVRHYVVSSLAEEHALVKRLVEARQGEVAVLFRNNRQGSALLQSFPEIEFRGETFLMTMHSSKGLEFDTVIIIGVDDAVIPDRNSPIEEERRLFYVALTRAKERLYIISRENSVFGKELAVSPSNYAWKNKG
ncbi:MAG: ATP-dependent helicase [Leptospirales bacterium]|nr:ATP-dependent helicase [Leptospirales bacterium]